MDVETLKKWIIILIITLVILVFVSRSNATTNDGPTSAFPFSQATVDRVNRYTDLVNSASNVYGIPSARIKAHIAVESAGNPEAKGKTGDFGLMQMTQIALDDINEKYSLGYSLENQFNPTDAITCGTAYLKVLLDRWGSLDNASVHYNPGDTGYLARIINYETHFA